MAIHAAEEETLEALKKWWEENGMRLVIMIIAVAGGYTGWLLWQNSQAAQADAASDLYEEILSLSLAQPDLPLSEADSNRIIEISGELKSAHANSSYAMFASLFEAQRYVANDDLDAAESALQWILDNQQSGLFNQTDEGLILTANLRLGRVILAKGDPERALALVNGIDPADFEAGFAELRGDIYLAMDRIVDARDAYIAAQQAGSNSDGLRMKLDNLSDES